MQTTVAPTRARHFIRSLPPGPKRPAIIQLLEWAHHPDELMLACREKYGDAFTLLFPSFGPQVFFSHPDAIKEIFTGSAEVYRAGESNAFLEPIVGRNSLLLLDGDRHLTERKMILPPFHGERMQAYGETMQSIVRSSIERWPIGQRFAIQPIMQTITLEIILSTVFGLDATDEHAVLRDKLQRLLAAGSNPLYLLRLFQVDLGPLTSWGELKRLKQDVERMILQAIAARRRQKVRGNDVLSMLIEAKDENGVGLDDAQLLDEMVTLLVAGHETTATALAWAIYHLHTNVDVLDALKKEIETVTEGRAIALDHLPKLELLDAVVKETLRLTPVIPVVGRHLSTPQIIAGHLLPADAYALPCGFLTHRRPDLYPDPERFKPARFLSMRPSPYEFLPFGGGVRRCVGMAFAMYEMKVVLGEIVSRAILRIAPNYEARVFHRSITLAPKGGVPVIVADRQERVIGSSSRPSPCPFG
jgi:cytochrome P450